MRSSSFLVVSFQFYYVFFVVCFVLFCFVRRSFLPLQCNVLCSQYSSFFVLVHGAFFLCETFNIHIWCRLPLQNLSLVNHYYWSIYRLAGLLFPCMCIFVFCLFVCLWRKFLRNVKSRVLMRWSFLLFFRFVFLVCSKYHGTLYYLFCSLILRKFEGWSPFWFLFGFFYLFATPLVFSLSFFICFDIYICIIYISSQLFAAVILLVFAWPSL